MNITILKESNEVTFNQLDLDIHAINLTSEKQGHRNSVTAVRSTKSFCHIQIYESHIFAEKKVLIDVREFDRLEQLSSFLYNYQKRFLQNSIFD